MTDVISDLFDTVTERRQTREEGSYTCYLFDRGLDKILKKVGEESAETIIAAKNSDNTALTGEICDLLYHLVVLAVERGLPWSEIEAELQNRAGKQHNLKAMKTVDRNT